ncbi:MAG TPA: AAA family ATPase, partial [Myxococcota bacterium]|nr:AAA family ATPase [Myxococcota bacterium]
MDGESPRFRLSKIHIRNYKSIDDLEVTFPPPRSPEQPDVFVLGSKNGVGKTSFLECCAWTLLAAKHKLTERLEGHAPFATVVRSGKEKALVVANALVEGHDRAATLHIHSSGFNVEAAHGWRERGTLSAAEDWYTRLLGAESEPLVLPPVLFFHSYRKVNEGSSALGDIVAPEFSYTRARYGRFGPTAL